MQAGAWQVVGAFFSIARDGGLSNRRNRRHKKTGSGICRTRFAGSENAGLVRAAVVVVKQQHCADGAKAYEGGDYRLSKQATTACGGTAATTRSCATAAGC